jgi:hypothetical protein
MTKEEFDNHFLQMSRRMMTPWELFKADLVKQPGYSSDQDQLYFDCFYCGLHTAHTLMAREILALYE